MPNDMLHIVMRKIGDVSNTINIDYKAGTGSYYDSSDGITWTLRTGSFNFRTYHSQRMVLSVEVPDVVQGDGQIRERIFPVRSDLEIDTVKEAALQVASTLSRERRKYEDIVITAPTDRIELGKFCKIYDSMSGLNIKANIIGLKLGMSTKGDDRMGAERITLQLDDYYK